MSWTAASPPDSLPKRTLAQETEPNWNLKDRREAANPTVCGADGQWAILGSKSPRDLSSG